MSSTARSATPRPSRAPSARTTRSATSRSAAGRSPSSRPAAPRTRRPALSAAPAPRASVAGNGMFALVVVGILLAGMVMLLVLNTTLAQGAFEISSLSRTQNQLAVQEQQLLQQVALEEAPDSLQKRAAALGMVPVTSPVFLRLADGAVLGIPHAAPAPVRALPRTGAPATAATSTTDAAQADPAPVTDAAARDTAPSTGGPPTAGTSR